MGQVAGAPVLIVGGGIGGLALAVGLARRGVASRVLERRTGFEEAGAGIQIGPNGVHVLRALGVAAAVDALAGRPEVIAVRGARTGATLATLPLGAAMEARHGAPYLTLHRADLHAALLVRANADAHISIARDFAVTDITQTADGVRVTASDGRAVEGVVAIGADGLWSRVRAHVAPGLAPVATGRRAHRAIVPVAAAPDALAAATATGLWLARGAHAVHYPVRGGAEIALVVVTTPAPAATTPSTVGWALPATAADVAPHVAGFAADLRRTIAAAEAWGAWNLFALPPLPTWTRGRVTLLGDAAHPMLPFLAQGAVMALEDALVLADLLATHLATARNADLPAVLTTYERLRRPRTSRVAATARRNGDIYHLAGPIGLARDLVLRATPGARLIAGYDWLYGWRGPD